MQEVIQAVRGRADHEGDSSVIARVVEIEGFSTRPGDDLVAVDRSGNVHGSLLAGLGNEALKDSAHWMVTRSQAEPALAVQLITFDIHDKEATSAGLACGGRAHLLLQTVSSIPTELWDLLAARAPVALITRLDGSAGSAVVNRSGQASGEASEADLIEDAVALVGAGRTDRRKLERSGVEYLIEAWVPDPRLVVVGRGELAEAIGAQADLLGWETRSCSGAGDDLTALLDWAGETSAMAVLSHDPHVDSPALAEGLRRGVAYVGALGSRSTQTRRTERLLAAGVEQDQIDRIHRPIGLDLGGRKAPEVALAIMAEVLASHCGRDARPLSLRDGPIH